MAYNRVPASAVRRVRRPEALVTEDQDNDGLFELQSPVEFPRAEGPRQRAVGEHQQEAPRVTHTVAHAIYSQVLRVHVAPAVQAHAFQLVEEQAHLTRRFRLHVRDELRHTHGATNVQGKTCANKWMRPRKQDCQMRGSQGQAQSPSYSNVGDQNICKTKRQGRTDQMESHAQGDDRLVGQGHPRSNNEAVATDLRERRALCWVAREAPPNQVFGLVCGVLGLGMGRCCEDLAQLIIGDLQPLAEDRLALRDNVIVDVFLEEVQPGGQLVPGEATNEAAQGSTWRECGVITASASRSRNCNAAASCKRLCCLFPAMTRRSGAVARTTRPRKTRRRNSASHRKPGGQLG